MMEVVEADDTPIYGPNVTHVQIAPAQRYSVIVNTNQGKAGQGFWMRTGTDTGASMNLEIADFQVALEMMYLPNVTSSFSATSTKVTRATGKDRLHCLGTLFHKCID